MTKSTVISSLLWKLLERGGAQGVQFIVQIVLARLLLPEQYGLIAIVMVFITLAQVFVQSGFNTALIQKKDADELDFSSVFYLSLIVSSILYAVIYFAAPFVAHFYMQPLLLPLLRVLSITLFFGAFNSIQIAFLSRNMLFKKLCVSSLVTVIISGVIGVAAAYHGWGVWALVIQQLSNQIAIVIILFFTVKWRPHLLFSLGRVKILFAYGSKLLASSLIDALFNDLRPLIIGRMYTSAMLGYYSRGEQFPKLISTNVVGSIQSVMLPALSSHQDDKKRVKEMMRRAIKTSSFLMFPMMVGMAVVAEPLVKILLTDKWLPAVPFMQIFCITFMLWPIHTANLQAINAIGRSDIFLKLEIIKKVMGLILLGISLPFGIYAIAISQLVSGVLSTFINAYPNTRLLAYGYREQLLDLTPSFLITLAMGSIVYLLGFFSLSSWITMILQVCVGILLYVVLAKVFKLEILTYLTDTMKQIIKTKKDASKTFPN